MTHPHQAKTLTLLQMREHSRKMATSKEARKKLQDATFEKFNVAMTESFKELGVRLAKIADATPEVQRSALFILNAQLGQVANAILLDPRPAKALEQGMASSLAIGLAGGNK